MMKKPNWLSKLGLTPKGPLPQISTPYNQALKSQQEVLIISLIIAVAVAGFYTYFYTQKKIAAEQKVAVVVAKANLDAPHTLTEGDLQTVMLPQGLLPAGHFLKTELDEVIGQTLNVSLKQKQLVLAHFIQSDLDPTSVSAQFDNAFALSMDEDWFVAKLPNLKANDLIDIVVTNPRGDLEATTVLARSLKVISISKAGNKRSLVVNSTEEEARAILFARGLKLPMQVLVHSAIKNDLPPENTQTTTQP